jgi:hypothetical protein
MTAVLVVSQDAIMVVRVQAYQRIAARAAAIVASSFRYGGVNLCGGGNGHCDISQIQRQAEKLAKGAVVRLFA